MCSSATVRLRVIYVCLNGVVDLIMASLNKMRSRSCPRGELDRFSLMLCFYSTGVPAGAASQAACGGYSPPPVRAAAKSVLWQASCKKPRTIKPRPGGFRLLGELLLLHIRREASGGWRGLEGAGVWAWLTLVCQNPPLFLCICVSRLLPRTSIWFDFGEMFTPPSKYPFITQTTE